MRIEPTERSAALVGAALLAGWALLDATGLPLREQDRAVPTAAAAIALKVPAAAVLYAASSRAPGWTAAAVAALATAIASGQALLAGGASTSVEAMYVCVALYGSYFLSLRRAAWQLAWIAVAYAAVLIAAAPDGSRALPWPQLVGAAALAGALLHAVRETVVGLARRLSDAARTDPLTGLENRRGLEDRLELEIERARRSGRPLAVAIGDVDHFKRVNDTEGHRAGDAALVRLAEVLAGGARRLDGVARSGGEEFTIVLPDTREHDAHLVAERLRSDVARAFADERVPLTLSVGIAAFPDHGHGAEALLEAADQALYSAKALGRNRTVIFNADIAAAFAPERARGLQGELQLATLLSLAEALDLRDTGTASHSRTVGRYCALIAAELELPPERVDRVRIAGTLHDIGKIGIPDAILGKPGRLSRVERGEVATHPEIGAQILSAGGFEDIRGWVLAHHERPDGRGYPRGLAGEQIPLEARIIAVADAYEAMTADRPYRAALGLEAARSELLRCSTGQFDARVVSALLAALRREAGPGPSAGREGEAGPRPEALSRLPRAPSESR